MKQIRQVIIFHEIPEGVETITTPLVMSSYVTFKGKIYDRELQDSIDEFERAMLKQPPKP
jgi:hypothetical protein